MGLGEQLPRLGLGFGLAHIENIGGAESNQNGLILSADVLLGLFILLPAYSDNGSENTDAVLSLLDLAAKLVPRVEASNAGCDLQHCETDRLLLMRGEAAKYNWKQHDKKSQARTPIMRLDAEEYSVDWNTAEPETWLLKELPDRIAQGYRRARILRMPFALQLQQAFIGRLGRVGTLAALPTRYAAGLRIFMRTVENKATLLVESTADQDDAICLVGRTEKNALMEWLLLSRSVKQRLRLALADRDAASFPNETPNLAILRSDPAFMRALGKGLIMNRKEKGSRPFEKTPFDVVQILANSNIANGQDLERSYRNLLIVVDFENASLSTS